jgi:hypothetical protein
MYGYGLWFYVDEAGKVVWFGKEGINVGVSGLVSHFPILEVTVMLLSNMEDGAREPVWKIHELVVSGQLT